jgi:hypothetical protein
MSSDESGWFESQTIPFSAKEWFMIRKAINRTAGLRDKNTDGSHFNWMGSKGKLGTSIGERMDVLLQDYDPKSPRKAYIQCNARSKPIPGKLRWRKEAAQADVPRVIVKQAGDRGTLKRKYSEGTKKKRRYRENVE